MKDITLQQLLEAGCHFGHKKERWHPRAAEFIYIQKDGVHIIDLAKTKAGLDETCTFIRDLVASGDEIVAVATKRQAREIVKTRAEAAGMPYFTTRWIGGFLTNWEEISKNIKKTNTMRRDLDSGEWKKYPKIEQSKMTHILEKLEMYYSGVKNLTRPPKALFIIDVKKEIAAVREGMRLGIPISAVVDTNSDPKDITHVIPANDDAVGSITLIIDAIARAYEEGIKIRKDVEGESTKEKVKEEVKKPEKKKAVKKKKKE